MVKYLRKCFTNIWHSNNCYIYIDKDFPSGSDCKESVCNVGDPGSIEGSGKVPWRREWLPTPVFLPGKSHGQNGSYGPWGRKESDPTERLTYTDFTYTDSLLDSVLRWWQHGSALTTPFFSSSPPYAVTHSPENSASDPHLPFGATILAQATSICSVLAPTVSVLLSCSPLQTIRDAGTQGMC